MQKESVGESVEKSVRLGRWPISPSRRRRIRGHVGNGGGSGGIRQAVTPLRVGEHLLESGFVAQRVEIRIGLGNRDLERAGERQRGF